MTRCAEYWRLSEMLRELTAAAKGAKTDAYHATRESLNAHLSTCPDCRDWFLSFPVEGKATVDIHPDL